MKAYQPNTSTQTMKFAEQFRRGLHALTSERFSALNPPDGYDFFPVVSSTWKTAEKRLLVVMEAVDRSDLQERRFLNTRRDERGAFINPITNLLPILLDKAHQFRNDWVNPKEPVDNDFAFGAISFNAAKTRHLSADLQKARHREFAARVISAISYMKPTHILCCGFTASHNLLEAIDHPELPHVHAKNGWVFPASIGGHDVQFCPTLDLDTLCSPPSKNDDQEDIESDAYAVTDLLYFVCRNATNLLIGHHPFSLKGLEFKPVLVDTIRKFDRVMELIEQADDLVSVDTETANLETVHNKVYFIQFAVDDHTGYVIPVDHPHESNPFSEKERRYIKRRLTAFFGEDRKDHLKTLVFQNGMFDLRVLRYQLSVKFVHHTIHELTAGEQLLDENIGILTRLKMRLDTEYVSVSYQNLKNMLCMYGNDFYYDETRKVNKTNRGRLSQFPVDDHDTLLYCAADVCLTRGIAKMQLLRGRKTRIRRSADSPRESYGRMYKIHLYNVMKSVCVSISHMEQDGSPIDIDYLKKLLGKESPVLKRMQEIENDFLSFDNVRAAEAAVMQAVGRSTTSLFSGYSTNAFSMAKKAHMEKLFFEVMKLPVVSYTDAGARAIDKVFIRTYEADHPEVKMFGEYVKATKLFSTYIRGWYKKLMSSVDTAKAFILRPGFGFFTIVTGRLNSYNPSLQQVPSRGAMAPIIHRMFIAPRGYLNIQADLNAAEVRGASVLARDEPLAESFKVGQTLRRQFMVTPTDEVKKKLKSDGDVHLLNVKRFFGKIVEKSHPLRSAVKAVVFGVLYGKSARTLGKNLQEEEIAGLMDERRKLVAEYRTLKASMSGAQK